MVRSHLAALLAFGALSACGVEDKCAEEEKFEAYADVDGDGYGAGDSTLVCALEAGLVTNNDDCDDENPDSAPGAVEACNGIDDNCDGTADEGLKTVVFYFDGDGDGYGIEAKPLVVCAAPDDTWARFAGDCDDNNENVSPGEDEVCNGVDDDCDLLTDDADDDIDVTSYNTYYPDVDGDGFPRQGTSVLACTPPPDSAVVTDFDKDGDDDFDCVDNNNTINPAALEICNGADDDCDGLRDDLDDSVDPSGFLEFPADADMDGDGDPVAVVLACAAGPQTGAANNTLDCNDSDPMINTNAPELLCDLVDNDCNPKTDDDRDSDYDLWSFCNGDCADNNALRNPDAVEIPSNGIDENCDTMELCYQDVDLDGARTETTVNVADPDCNDAGNARETQPIDCDDNNAKITISGDWELDADLDGYGDGTVVLTDTCVDPGPGYALAGGELDCADDNFDVNPGQTVDLCNDGFDADCNGLDSCASCFEYLVAGETTDGVYPVRPIGGDVELDVYCDMTTDGGGWTLVGSSIATINDVGGAFHEELDTLDPTGGHSSVWNGLSNLVVDTSDMRFACKLDALDTTFAVDMSFYATPWYSEIAAANNDLASCFSEPGYPDQPARRNNLTGEYKDTSDAWDSGALVGEDSCGDVGDFTVDFDDRGMDGASESDGTDWGESDGKGKCGVSNAGASWFIFVREN